MSLGAAKTFGGGSRGLMAGGIGGSAAREFAKPRSGSKFAGDKRFAPRRAHKLSAYVSSEANGAAEACYVRDSSSTGLMIEMRGLAASAERLSDRVKVFIPIENVEFDCKVMWRAGSRAGLRFMTAARHHRHLVKSAAAQGAKKPRSLIGRLFSRG